MRSPAILVVEAVLVLALGSAADGVRKNETAAPVGAAESRQTIPIDRLIERLVADLSAERYDTREQATESLRRIGRPALEALERAAESDDPEVRTRAREVLEDVRLGITPDWPSEMILLARHYDQLPDQERQQALYRMGQMLGVRAVPFLVQRLASENPNEARAAIAGLQNIRDDEAARQTIALIPEPKTVFQTQALAWARARTGAPAETLRLLVTGAPDDSLRNQAIEAGVKSTLAMLRDHKYEEAAKSAGEMAKAADDEARLAYLEAEANMALDKPDAAKALREKALAMNPNDEARHAAPARLLEELGRRRLAAMEWETVLRIPPAGTVYDVNANLSLASIYEASGLFDQAAKAMQTALDQYGKAREARGFDRPRGLATGQGMAMVGGTEDGLKMQILRLTHKAAQFPAGPDAAVEDEIDENELCVNIGVSIKVKDGQADDLRRQLADATACVTIDLQPEGLRLFEDVPITLRYDPAKKELVALLSGSPCGKPMTLDLAAAGKEARLAVSSLDRGYLFHVNTATGEMKEIARYEKDYRVSFKPGVRLLALTNAVVKINGKRYGWDEMQNGITFDYLPRELDVTVEGMTPAGRQITARAKLTVREPPFLPPEEAKSLPE
jgi:tetratricopeptide (TPR) repeat protein